MLIRLSNNYYINPEKITCITPRIQERYEEPDVTEWHITFDSENSLILSQAHFEELMACLPTPVEVEKRPTQEFVEGARDGLILIAKREVSNG